AMQRLGASAKLLARYRNMERDDLKITTGIVDDPATHRTRQKSLAWFWTMNLAVNAGEQEKNEYLDDFYRVHWLCARAMRTWWVEEFTLLRYEMDWVVRFFWSKEDEWHNWAVASGEASMDGHRCYAACQAHLWSMFATHADDDFRKTL
ncbi:hypothetical protein JAAARDRAFT_89288, partial [Jaapia argillacea MUCL 33604]